MKTRTTDPEALKSDTLTRLTELLEHDFGVLPASIRLEAKFIEDLGLDSLDIVEMTMGVEEEWGLDITDETIDKMTTVGDLVTYLLDNPQI